MRWRTGFAWALAGSIGLALLVLAGYPTFTVGVPAGMSAPSSAPAASIESAFPAQFLQPQFDLHRHALRALCFSLALVAVRARADARQDRDSAPQYFGPLHRRP